jgi:hypothetical protein
MRALFWLLLIICGPCAAAPCDPEPFGSGTHSTLIYGSGAIGASWICMVNGEPRVSEPIVMRTAYVPPAGCATSVAGLVMDMQNLGSSALLAKCSAPWPAAEIPLRDAIAEQTRMMVSAKWNRDHPPPVKVKVCTVAVNGTAKTRQWYSYVSGVRATVGGGSVNVGLACQAPILTEGSVTYSAFGPTFRADRVTVCTCQ